MKQQAALPAPAAPAPPALTAQGIVVRIHGDDQYRLDASLRPDLDTYDRRLVAAVQAGDDADYHAVLREVTVFVKAKGVVLGTADVTKSDIILPSDDMPLEEVTGILNQEGIQPAAGSPA
jgi:hypothetical protein